MDKPITADSFKITRTPKGQFTVRWVHNNAALITRREKQQAEKYIKWLVDYLNTPMEFNGEKL